MTGNVSKARREALLKKIRAIRAFIEEAAAGDENAARLLEFADEIEREARGKKYGLVFEEHREEIDEILESHLPVLTEEKALFVNNSDKAGGGLVNFLIEGDNLAALALLQKTHAGKIDVIYIDPPYNTGAKNWIYGNDYVDANDIFRHSKWLSFMKSRLLAARNRRGQHH